jgi:Domain of unknown function (DUF6457)
MTAEDWIRAFANEIDATAPSPDEMNEILRLAGIAAHASERIAAPIACYLVGASGRSLADALQAAEDLSGAES